MPGSLITFFSQSGTTARVASAIAAGLRAVEWQVDLCSLKDKQPPEIGGYDVIGVGFPVYYFRPPFNVTDYVKNLPDLKQKASFVFLLHGTYPGDAGTTIRRTLARKGARELGYLLCRGEDHFPGYLKRGYLFSPGDPSAEELARAEIFGREIAARFAGQPYVRADEDPPLAAVYRLERFLTNRWFTRQMYSRLFSLKGGKCDACGLCMRLCPTGNITKDKNRNVVWGRNCLLCLTCELKCPQEAITSLVSRRLFAPFIGYNVNRATGDRALEHARVVYEHGRIRPDGRSSAVKAQPLE